MLNNTLNYIKNFFQRNKGGNAMETRKTITFTVMVSIASKDEHSWLKNVRLVRKELKENIGRYSDMKILKIDSKEG
jgi:hypothetical protein